MKYKVWVYIQGAINRPPYEGYVHVWSNDRENVPNKARQELRRTAFPDVWPSYIKIKKIEVCNE